MAPLLSKRESELPPAIIGKLLKVAVENKEVISLGPGEPDFPAPQPIVDWTREFASSCNHYSPPGGRQELKEAIVKKLKRENGIRATPENVIATAGSQEALLLATACSLDVGEQVLIPNPSFMAYLPTVEMLDISPVFVPLTEQNGFEPDPDQVRKLIDKKKTKVMILNTPANPTGNVMKKKTLEELADIAVENDMYIFSDEAYEKIIYNGKKHLSIGSFNGMKDYVVSFYTFSKTYAMCGYRLGYATGPEKLIEAMTKAHIYTSISPSTLSQMVGARALELNESHIRPMVNEYDRRRRLIVRRLNEVGLPTVEPDGAFYTFSNIQGFSKDSIQFANDLLKKAKVAVVPGVEFGSFGEGFIRCSYATQYEKIAAAMDRIENFLKSYKSKK